MDPKKEAKKFFNKFFKHQWLDETSSEFKSLVKVFNKFQRQKDPILVEIRTAVADYMRSEGCSCCRDQSAHEEAEERLAKLLGVEKYSDGSGYNFDVYTTPKTKK